MLLAIVNVTFSQQSNLSSVFTTQDYLQKSKNQKKIALILLGGGATLTLTGIIIPKGEVTDYNSLGDKTYKNDGIKGVFVTTGILSMIGSIPIFIASCKNKKRAMSVSFKNDTIPQMQKSSFVYHPIPSLKLKISL